MSNSLKARLLWLLCAAIVAIACGQAVIAYQTALAETSSIFDYQMQQMAKSLRKGLPISNDFGRKTIDPETQDEKFDFVVQIWAAADGRRIFRSTERAGLPRQSTIGFSSIYVNGAAYRIYLTSDGDKFIQVAQYLGARQGLARTLALRTVSPIGLLVPILLILVWWVVRTSLAPVDRVRQQVASRNADSLDRVSEDEVPDEVRPLVQELNLLFSRVYQAFEAQRNFVSDAAHELRSPLAALKLQVEGLRRAQNVVSREISVQRLNAGVDRATHLVEQLLILARQQAVGLGGILRSPIEVSHLVQTVIEELTVRASARNIDLFMLPAIHFEINGQEEALRVLIRNLIENSIKYAPQGGRIEVSLYRSQRACVFQVDDNGPGIPLAERVRVLDRFYRIANAESIGSGLGLAIVQTIVNQHGAHMDFDSAPVLGGLRVRVYFDMVLR